MYEYQCGEFGCGYWGFKGEYFFFFLDSHAQIEAFQGQLG